MFLGHYGMAFALKRVEPKVSLGTLFVAVQLADVLWACFLLIGWEQVRIDPTAGPLAQLQFVHYPISHSLVGSLAWALRPGAVLLLAYPGHQPTLAGRAPGRGGGRLALVPRCHRTLPRPAAWPATARRRSASVSGATCR